MYPPLPPRSYGSQTAPPPTQGWGRDHNRSSIHVPLLLFCLSVYGGIYGTLLHKCPSIDMGHGTEEESGNSESPSSAFLAGQYATTFLMMVTLSNDTFAVFKQDFQTRKRKNSFLCFISICRLMVLGLFFPDLDQVLFRDDIFKLSE